MIRERLLAVDGQPVFLEGLRLVLSSEGYEVFTAGTAKETLMRVCSIVNLKMLVICMNLTDCRDVLDLIREIRMTRPGIHTLAYITPEEIWKFHAEEGSDVEGVVMKGENIDVLREALRTVCKGSVYRSPEFLERLDTVKKMRGILSKTGMDILHLVSEGMPTYVIAKNVNLSYKSVEYHRSNIIKKLGSKNMTEAIRNAVKLGIISCMAGSIMLF